MSSVITAPEMTPVAVATPTFFDEKAFIEKHKETVAADLRKAVRKMRHGRPYSLTVTPESLTWRCADSALTHVDVSGWDCQEAQLLRRMYRHEALAHGLDFRFDVETRHRVGLGDTLVDVHLLIVVLSRA